MDPQQQGGHPVCPRAGGTQENVVVKQFPLRVDQRAEWSGDKRGCEMELEWGCPQVSCRGGMDKQGSPELGRWQHWKLGTNHITPISWSHTSSAQLLPGNLPCEERAPDLSNHTDPEKEGLHTCAPIYESLDVI